MKSGNRRIQRKLSPCKINLDDLTKIASATIEINDLAKKHQFQHERALHSNQNFSDSELERILSDNMLVTTNIWGADGEYTALRNAKLITNADLPSVVTKIQFDNSSYFNFIHQKAPMNDFKLTFDCTTPVPYDFSISPSSQTPNESEVWVLGEDNTWVQGTSSRLLELSQRRKENHLILHSGATYDFALWFAFAPTTISYLMKFDKHNASAILSYSPGVQALIYFALFFMSVFGFRLLFGLLRWLYPYVEIENHSNRRSANLRRIVVLALTGLWLSGMYDLLKWWLLKTD